MVCIAAFIILTLIGVFVAIVSIFKPKVGKAYWKMFKKAWGCLWKKVRLQKCETGFKDDVKNTLLSRVIIKHPKWVKPLSVIIEVISVIIVIFKEIMNKIIKDYIITEKLQWEISTALLKLIEK